MFSAVRVLVVCMGCAFYALAAITPDEAVLLPAVFDDFSNNFGDKNEQNAFGAAKGVIEKGTGKAYLGGGYWYGTADAGSSVTGADGTKIKSSLASAIDTVEKCLHVIMTTSTSSAENPYAVLGSTLTNDDEYYDLSKMTGLVVTAKGTGTVRVNLVTKDYIDADEAWGFYGVDITLTAAKKTTTTAAASIEPAEWSYGYENDLTWAADGAKALNKVEIQVKDGDDADLYLYEITFGGMTYGDFGFEKVPVVYTNTRQKLRNGLTVKNSRVNYTIAQPQNVSIQVMNMAGCRVATLFTGNVAAGSHTVPMNFQNIAGGQYFIHVNGTGFSASQPITIAK